MKKFILALLALAMVATGGAGTATAGEPPSALLWGAQCVVDAWVLANTSGAGPRDGAAPLLAQCGQVNPRLWSDPQAADFYAAVLDQHGSENHVIAIWGEDGELDTVESAVILTPKGWGCDQEYWSLQHELRGRPGPAPVAILYEAGAEPFAEGSPPVCPDPQDGLLRFRRTGGAAPVAAAKRPAPKAAPAPKATPAPTTPVVVDRQQPAAPAASPAVSSDPVKTGCGKTMDELREEVENRWQERRKALLAEVRTQAAEDAAWARMGAARFHLGVEGTGDFGAYGLEDFYRGARYTSVKAPALGWAVSLGATQVFGLPLARPDAPPAGPVATLVVEGYGGGLQWGGVQAGVRAGLLWAKRSGAPLAVGWRFGARGDAYGVFSQRGAGALWLPGVGTTHEAVLMLGPANGPRHLQATHAPVPHLWAAGGVYLPIRWAAGWASKPGQVRPSPTVSVGLTLDLR
jgi:hypothetical protein